MACGTSSSGRVRSELRSWRLRTGSWSFRTPGESSLAPGSSNVTDLSSYASQRRTTLASSTRRSRIMTTAADQFNDTPSPTDLQQFAYLANNVFELLETAKRELARDREMAKASLATASSILQSEIERCSRAKGARPDALAAWQIARVRAFIDENLHRTIHTKDLSAVAQRSTAHFSRSFKQAFGEPPHAYVVRRRLERACQLMITSTASLPENSPERRPFRSSTSVQALQAGV